MKQFYLSALLILSSGVAAFAQADPGINILTLPPSIPVTQSAVIQVDVANNGNFAISAGCLVVTLSVPSGIATITGVGAGSDASWVPTITNGGSTVQLVNTNGGLPALSAIQTINVTIKGTAPGGPSTIVGNIAYNPIGGSACIAAGNLSTSNDNSTTSIIVTESSTPVTIAAFSARAAGANAQLDWVTSAERNNAFFDILHSTDLKNFESLGKVNGKGTTSARNTYSFTHFNPDPAVIHYYKLRQVDFDGTYADQPVRSVQFDSYVGIGLKAHADAARNVRVFVDYGDEHLAANATVSILDVNGQKVGARNVQLSKGRNTIDFASASLASGVYLVRLENDSKNASVRIVLP